MPAELTGEAEVLVWVLSSLAICFLHRSFGQGHERGTICRGVKLILVNPLGFETSGNDKVDLYGICNRGASVGALCCKGFCLKARQMYRKVKVGCLVVSLTICLIQPSWLAYRAVCIGQYR